MVVLEIPSIVVSFPKDTDEEEDLLSTISLSRVLPEDPHRGVWLWRKLPWSCLRHENNPLTTTLYRLPGFSCSRSRVLSAALLSCRCCRRSEVAGINIRIRKGCKWKRKLGFANCKRRHLKGVLCSSSPFAMSGLITWEPRSTKSFLLPLRGYIHPQPK